MLYCTQADINMAIPVQTQIWLSSDDPVAAEPDLAVIEESVRQAEEQVNGFLRGRYLLPLQPVPTLVKDITVHLARHWLYGRRPEGRDFPDAVVRTYKDAMRMLEYIRDNKITLGAAGDGASVPEPGEMKVRAKSPTFSNDLLERY